MNPGPDDPILNALVAEFGVPVETSRPPTFASLALFILEQQVSLASAAATFEALRARQGPLTPQAILTHPDLRADGVSRQKQRYLTELAMAVDSGRLDLEALNSADDDHVRSSLEAIPGIGRWTSDVYLLICLQRPDIWPIGDRALQVGVQEALGLGSPPTPAELEHIGDRWRPYRSEAARILWHAYLARRGRVPASGTAS